MLIYIIIPAYNEEGRILKTLRAYSSVFKRHGIKYRIIVVSESDDRTNGIVSLEEMKNPNVSILSNKRKQGKGGAIIIGMKRALKECSQDDIVGFVDADNAVYANEAIKLVEKLLHDRGIDGAIASRYMHGSRIIGKVRPARYLASRGYNILVRLILGLSFADTQCGAKFFTARSIKSVIKELSIVDMSFDIDLLYSLKVGGFKVSEIPIRYRQVNEGSKLVLRRQIPQMLIVAMGFRLARSRYNKLVPKSLRGYVYNRIKKW